MISSLIIVFREVLEAALVIGIVMAASKEVKNSVRWINLGVLVGIVGSCVVAAFAQSIAMAASGLGQELFNAVVLLIAVLMLGWHNVWMAKQGKEIANQIKSDSNDISTGTRPLYWLSIIVGMAVLREGSEVILFLYGIAAGGVESVSLLAGSGIGLVSGAFTGSLLYFGLLRIPTRFLFAVTSGLLLLLAAGMASQIAVLLVQADLLHILPSPVWDTSAIVAKNSLLGQFLHAIIGYDDRPLGIQLVFYLFTLIIIGSCMKVFSSKSIVTHPKIISGLSVLLVGFLCLNEPHSVKAEHKIFSPIVEEGEWGIEARSHYSLDNESELDGMKAGKIGIEYGVNSFWKTEVELEYEYEKDEEKTELEEIASENIFQLAPQGKYWLDFGLFAEYAKAGEEKHPDKIELGPLLQKNVGKLIMTYNLIFEREVGENAEDEIEMEMAGSAGWRLDSLFEPRLEFFKTEDQQLVGPAIIGKCRIGDSHLKYEFGIARGMNDTSPDTLVRWLLEFEL